MGREWYLNWGTKSSSKKVKTAASNGGCSRSESSGGGYNGGCSRKSTTPQPVAAAAAAATAGGCMNAVLHLFDFQLCLHPQDSSFLPDDPTPPKGLEAPRNSLESITEEKDYNLHIHKDIQIKTNRRDTELKLVQVPRGKLEDFSSESSYSPASARTPTLVARLMGLDILPESNTTTPRSSHSQISPHIKTPTPSTTTTTTKAKKTRASSPETPRSSTSMRRRSTDVVDHHRLSLQINKENSIVKEMELSRPSCSAISTKRKDGNKNYEDEVTKSPSYYARQIMKQVKETVSRRVGMDITNTFGASREHRRDEHLLSSTTTTKDTKTKKTNKKDHKVSSSTRFKTCVDNNNKIISSKPDHQHVQDVKELSQNMVIAQAKTVGSENESLKKLDNIDNKTSLVNKKPFKSYDSMRNKKDEQFVRPSNSTMGKRSKKTMLSSELLHGTVPSLVPLKKDTHSKLLDKEGVSSHVELSRPIIKNTTMGTTMTMTTTSTTRLSRYPRQRINERTIKEEATYAPADRRWRSQKEATATSIMEFQYITTILKCTGIDRDTPVSFMRWFLPSQPLDPTIYHTLEDTHYLTTSDKFACDKYNLLTINRKLIFHLVDEMLVDILKPYVKHHYYHHNNHLDYHHHQQINGFQLVKLLCSKIRSFPNANCQTLQDIDALVEKDLPTFGATNNMITYQDDSEEIVSEIEKHIMNSLVQEIFCLS